MPFVLGGWYHFTSPAALIKMYSELNLPPPCGPISQKYFWHRVFFLHPRKITGIILFSIKWRLLYCILFLSLEWVNFSSSSSKGKLSAFCGDDVLLSSHSPPKTRFSEAQLPPILPPVVRLVEAHSLLSTQDCLQWSWLKFYSLLSIHCLHLLVL